MIVAIGDIHGKISQLTNRLEELNIGKGVDYVQLGDFGLGFDSPLRESRKLKELDLLLARLESRMWVIRGNHDNPIYWDPNYSYDLENIRFVPDNTFLQIAGSNCFFAGGAISIDRINRRKGVSYWQGESYTWSIPLITPENVDVVFTHEVYHPCSPFTMQSPIVTRWMEQDKTLRRDMTENQMEMKKMYEFLSSINHDFSWYHGHYHESHTTIVGKQKTHSLAELEFKEVI